MAAATNGTLSSNHANGTSGGAAPPKIQLYTNHRCPYAHRAHIVLEELKLPFEETIIDLDTPRPQWYLDINPRGTSFV
jgi:glutathione S-transferase